MNAKRKLTNGLELGVEAARAYNRHYREQVAIDNSEHKLLVEFMDALRAFFANTDFLTSAVLKEAGNRSNRSQDVLAARKGR